ncbi:type VII secretion protein EssB/YukC [Staphylococcus aureus]
MTVSKYIMTLMSNHTPFDNIKSFTKNEKLRYLLNIKNLEEVNRTRYTFVLAPDELFFTRDGLPIAKTRGLQNVVKMHASVRS